MSKMIFSGAEYAASASKPRREVFLDEREQKGALEGVAGFDLDAPPGRWTRRKPYPLESMLRGHRMQNCFALSDSVMERPTVRGGSQRCVA